jgi:hypothetical protein
MAFPEPGALWCVHTLNATRMVFLLCVRLQTTKGPLGGALFLRAHWPDDVSIKEIMHFCFFLLFCTIMDDSKEDPSLAAQLYAAAKVRTISSLFSCNRKIVIKDVNSYA